MSDEKRYYRPDPSHLDSDLNPYASPPNVESPDSSTMTNRMKNSGLLARAVFGLWAGVLFGGTFGAGGSVMLGITNGAILGWHTIGPPPGIESPEQFFMTEIVAAITGAILGLFAGGFIGPIVSVISFFSKQSRRSVIWSAIVLSAVSGCAVGLIGSRILTQGSISDWRSAAIGIIVGSLSGILGGFQLGRGIISFAKGEIS